MLASRKKAIFSLIFATFIWASTYSVVKVGLQEIGPLTLALIRGGLATVLLLIFCILKGLGKEVLSFFKHHYLMAFILGTTGMFLMQIFNNLGLQYSSSIMGGVLINTSPILILILSALFLKERFTSTKIIGIILGFIGILFITLMGENFSDFNTQNTLIGNALLLGVALCWAVYLVIMKKFLKKFSPLTLTFVSFCTGTLLFIPLTLYTENLSLMYHYGIFSWGIILYLGFFGSTFAYLLWNYGTQYIDVSRASIY